MTNQSRFIYFNSRDELLRIDISKVVYFEADGNFTNIMMSNKNTCKITANLGCVQDLLSARLKDNAKSFARLGRSYIINLNYVFHIKMLTHKLVLSDGERFSYELSVSKEALKALKEGLTLRIQRNQSPDRNAEMLPDENQ